MVIEKLASAINALLTVNLSSVRGPLKKVSDIEEANMNTKLYFETSPYRVTYINE